MKKILPALFLFFCTVTTKAQTPADYNIKMHSLQYYFNHLQFDSVYQLFSANSHSILTADSTKQIFNTLYYQLGEMRAYELIGQKNNYMYYKGRFRRFNYNMMVLLDSKNTFETVRILDRDSTDTAKSDYFVRTPMGNINGVLTVPPGIHKIPLVVIMSSAGFTDKHGNSVLGLNADTYDLLADSLKKANIACLHFDYRGVGESADVIKSLDSLTIDSMIKDGIGMVTDVRAHWHFSKIIILGHGEGSLVGMQVAQKVKGKVSGVISVEGLGQPADKVIEKQLKSRSKRLAKASRVIMDSLKAGYTVNNVDTSLKSLFDPSMQAYSRSWLKYDPQEEIKKVTVPVLIIQGTNDLQVSVKEAKKLKKARPDATLEIVDGMNYILKQAPDDKLQNMATYTNPKLPLSPGLIPAIVKFINDVPEVK